MSLATLYRVGGDIQAINADYADYQLTRPGLNYGKPIPQLRLDTIASFIGAPNASAVRFCESTDGQRLAYVAGSQNGPINEAANQWCRAFKLRGDVLKVPFESTFYAEPTFNA